MADTDISVTLQADTKLETVRDATLNADTKREVIRTVTLEGDTSLKTKGHVRVAASTFRHARFHATLKLDTSRNLSGHVTAKADTLVCVTNEVQVGDNGVYIQTSKGKGRIVSVRLNTTTSDMTDTLTIVFVNADLNLHDKLSGKILDYDLTGFEVASISKTGIQTTVKATQNLRLYGKAILYWGNPSKAFLEQKKKLQQVKSNTTKSGSRFIATRNGIRGNIHVEWIGTDDEKFANNFKKTEAKTSLRGALNYLGVEYKIGDWMITTDLSGRSGTLAGFVSTLISWTKSIPMDMIVAHVHGNKVRALQRGYEDAVTDISSMRHPVETEKTEEDSNYVSATQTLGYKIGVVPEVKFNVSHHEGNKNKKKRLGHGETQSNDMAGRPLHYEKRNDDGSGESVDYEYIDGDDVNEVIEHHKKWDAGNENEPETWTITHDSVADNSISRSVKDDDSGTSSVLGTNRISSFFNSSVEDDERWDFLPYGVQGYKIYDIHRIDNKGNDLFYEEWQGEENMPFPLVASTCCQLVKRLGKYRKITTLQIAIVSPVSSGVPEYKHIITHDERIKYKGKEYFLDSNDLSITTKEYKQTLVLKRYDPM